MLDDHQYFLIVFPVIELSIFGGFKCLQKFFSLLQLFLLSWLVPFVLCCQYLNHTRQCPSCCIGVKESKTSPPCDEINRRFAVFVPRTVYHLRLQKRVTMGKSLTQTFILHTKYRFNITLLINENMKLTKTSIKCIRTLLRQQNY